MILAYTKRVTQSNSNPSENISISAILRGVCPKCKTGKFYKGLFSIRRRCSVCDYDFCPESGFYLGAMMIAYFLTTILTVPVVVALKFAKVDIEWLVAAPLIEYALIGGVLIRYSRILWLHLEYHLTRRLDGK